MYDFHNNHMKMRYPEADQLKLLFTDTASLAHAIKTDGIYADMLNDNHLFDFSDYQNEHPCFANIYRQVQRWARWRTPTGICRVTSKTVLAAIRRGAE